jgi:hypothetical protein
MIIPRKMLLVPAAVLVSQLLLPSLTYAKDIYADQAPPAAKEERAPSPRDGYIWGQGHWEWSGKSYFWVSGNWVVQRHGMRFIPDHWDQEGAKWHFVASRWERV